MRENRLYGSVLAAQEEADYNPSHTLSSPADACIAALVRVAKEAEN